MGLKFTIGDFYLTAGDDVVEVISTKASVFPCVAKYIKSGSWVHYKKNGESFAHPLVSEEIISKRKIVKKLNKEKNPEYFL